MSEIDESRWFTLTAEETRDISNKEQPVAHVHIMLGQSHWSVAASGRPSFPPMENCRGAGP